MIALAFLVRDGLIQASYRTAFAMDLVGVLFTAATFYFLARLIDPIGQPQSPGLAAGYFPFVVVGVVTTDLLAAAMHGVSASVRREQLTGTLEPLLAAPTSPLMIACCLPLFEVAQSLGRGAAYLVVGWLLFGLQLVAGAWPVVMLAVLLTVACSIGIGMVGASFVLLLKRGDPAAWLVSTAMGLVGGVYFPVEILPEWLQAVAAFLPITYALRVLRAALLAGEPFVAVAPDLAALAAFAALLLPVGLKVFDLAVRSGRAAGTLGHY